MAARNFNGKDALEREIKDLYVRAQMGADSASPTIVSAFGSTRIERNGVGDYTLVLDDTYNQIKYFKGIVLNASAVDASFQIKEDLIKTARVRFLIMEGATPVDLDSSAQIFLKLELKNVAE